MPAGRLLRREITAALLFARFFLITMAFIDDDGALTILFPVCGLYRTKL